MRVHPDEAGALENGKALHDDPREVGDIVLRQRRHVATAPVRGEAPAVERAHERVPVEAALREGHAAVGAAVAHAKGGRRGRGRPRSAPRSGRRPAGPTSPASPHRPRLRDWPTQYHALPRGRRIASGSRALVGDMRRIGEGRGQGGSGCPSGRPSYAPGQEWESAGRGRTNGRRPGTSQARRGHLPSRLPQPTKGGDPVSHCHQPCVSAHRTWTVASGASL